MAFTAQEKALCFFYLGYSGFEDDGPARRAIDSMDAKESTFRPIVKPILDELQALDREIGKVKALTKAIEDGSVKIRAHYTIEQLWRLGTQQVGRLSGFLKVAVKHNVFSSSIPYASDGFYSGDPSENRLEGGEYTLGAGGQPRTY